MKTIISRFTMKYIKTEFVDIVSGESICSYIDKYNDIYLASYPFYPFNFRIKINKNTTKYKSVYYKSKKY